MSTVTASKSIGVVERAFFVLQAVAASDGPLAVRELARRTDLSPATTLRLVRTLTGLGMVDRLPDGQVALGSGVSTLTGNGAATPTADQLNHLLGRIVETFGEAATAAIDAPHDEAGGHTLFISHVAPDSPIQIADVTGDRWPAHTTASGIVLMGAWAQDRLEQYLVGDLSWDAPNVITNPKKLRRRVMQAKSDGFAWSVEELMPDAAGLAVPVINAEGSIVAAVGLYAPTYRLHPDLPGLVDLPVRLMDLVGRLRPVVF